MSSRGEARTVAAPLRARRMEEKATMMMEWLGSLGDVSIEREVCVPYVLRTERVEIDFAIFIPH